MLLLHCRSGIVIAHHDSADHVAPDYGDDTRVIPYAASLATLARVGERPPWPWKPSMGDLRPYATPTETPELLIAYAGQKRWEVANAGIEWQAIPLKTDRVSQTLISNLAQYADSLNPNSMINFTQDGHAYTVKAKDATDMFVQFNAHLQKARDVETACLYDIENGIILTYDDVDARFAELDATTLRGMKKKQAKKK